jgi:hypothetical protein
MSTLAGASLVSVTLVANPPGRVGVPSVPGVLDDGRRRVQGVPALRLFDRLLDRGPHEIATATGAADQVNLCDEIVI